MNNFGLLLQLHKKSKVGKQLPNGRKFAKCGHPEIRSKRKKAKEKVETSDELGERNVKKICMYIHK
jgi:hypothetical protein